MHATNPGYLAQLTKLADSVHKYGAKIFGQIHHGGNSNDPCQNSGELVSASGVPSISGMIPRPLTTDEVESLVRTQMIESPILF